MGQGLSVNQCNHLSPRATPPQRSARAAQPVDGADEHCGGRAQEQAAQYCIHQGRPAAGSIARATTVEAPSGTSTTAFGEGDVGVDEVLDRCGRVDVGGAQEGVVGHVGRHVPHVAVHDDVRVALAAVLEACSRRLGQLDHDHLEIGGDRGRSRPCLRCSIMIPKLKLASVQRAEDPQAYTARYRG